MNKETIPFSTPWFDVVARTVGDCPEPFYSLRLGDYVTVIARTPEDRILVVRQFRHAINRETLEFPSGNVDVGETPEFAARRELEEETGYTTDHMQDLGVLAPDTGRLGNRLWCYYANVRKMQPVPAAEAGIELLQYTPAELVQMIRAGSFDHALNIAALFLCMDRGYWSGNCTLSK